MDAKAIRDGLLVKSRQASRAGLQVAEKRKVLPPAGDERTAMPKEAGTLELDASLMHRLEAPLRS